jgi:hypothetical protein
MARFKRLQFKTAAPVGLIGTTATAGCEEAILVLALPYGIEEDLLPLLGHQIICVTRQAPKHAGQGQRKLYAVRISKSGHTALAHW